MMKAYLAGGTHSNWQDIFIKRYPNCEFIDPSDWKGLIIEPEYTTADVIGINGSDLLICYFEPTNPSGLGLAFEIGYAVGLGIPVVLIDEKKDKYAGMLRASAQVTYDKLYDSWVFFDALFGEEGENLELETL